jgi:hypothetical protein
VSVRALIRTVQFLLHGDFILIANREDIEKSNQWNDRLLEGLAECFIQAIIKFNSADALVLRYSWLQYLQDLPDKAANNFSSLTKHIFDRLRSSPVLESQSGDFVCPAEAFIIPPGFRDAENRFVLNCAGESHRYLSAAYDTHKGDQALLRSIGAEVLSFSQFFEILKMYMTGQVTHFRGQNSEWHSLLAKILCERASDVQLQSLVLVPLRTGRWISKVEGQAHFETSETEVAGEIPEGVAELLVVEKTVSDAPQRRRLLERLGVKNLNRAEVCRLIISCHQSVRGTAAEWDVNVYVSHAAYLFDATLAGALTPEIERFWVLSLDGKVREAKRMYLDDPDATHRIGSLLPDAMHEARLLHPGYLAGRKRKYMRNWKDWLEEYLGIRQYLSIASGERFTPEFQYLIDTQPSHVVLDVLIDSWGKYPAQMTDKIKSLLGNMHVLCESAQRFPLKETCLKIPSLQQQAYAGIQFVKLNDPRKVRWHRLKDLGVITEPNMKFYLRCLQSAQGNPVRKEEITGLYEKIDIQWVKPHTDQKALW